MLARIMADELNRIILILVLKKFCFVFLLRLRPNSINNPVMTRKVYENEVNMTITLVRGLEITIISEPLTGWMKCVKPSALII